MSSTAQMDDATRAMCYALRHLGRGHKPMKYVDIRKVVKKTDGKRPSVQAIAQAVASYPVEKKSRGRKTGWRKTSRDEDKIILKTFHQKKPPGCGVTSRVIHDAMPRPLRNKICKRTVIRRLAKKDSKIKNVCLYLDFSFEALGPYLSPCLCQCACVCV